MHAIAMERESSRLDAAKRLEPQYMFLKIDDSNFDDSNFDDSSFTDLTQLSNALSEIDAETRVIQNEPEEVKLQVVGKVQEPNAESASGPRQVFQLRII
ncbi:MAG TPA: hypothetical protein PLZ95_12875 [Bryobacteraceae bacterium]|nr:hypothetical protein [Bryobacteraceae bacterium]